MLLANSTFTTPGSHTVGRSTPQLAIVAGRRTGSVVGGWVDKRGVRLPLIGCIAASLQSSFKSLPEYPSVISTNAVRDALGCRNIMRGEHDHMDQDRGATTQIQKKVWPDKGGGERAHVVPISSLMRHVCPLQTSDDLRSEGKLCDAQYPLYRRQ